jgi:hypothetical protein
MAVRAFTTACRTFKKFKVSMFSRALIANTFLVSKLFLQLNFRLLSKTDTKKMQTEINRYVGGPIHRFNPQTNWLTLPKKEGGFGVANIHALSAACWEHWRERARELIDNSITTLSSCKKKSPLLRKITATRAGPSNKNGATPLKHLYEINLYENITRTTGRIRKPQTTIAATLAPPKTPSWRLQPLGEDDLGKAKTIRHACITSKAGIKTHELMLRWEINKLPVKLRADYRRDNCTFCDSPKPSCSHLLLECNQLTARTSFLINELYPQPLPLAPRAAATLLNTAQFRIWSSQAMRNWKLYCKQAFNTQDSYADSAIPQPNPNGHPNAFLPRPNLASNTISVTLLPFEIA